MKAFVTKHALTKGIIEVEATVNPNVSDDMIMTKEQYPAYYHKGEWFETKYDAIEKAESMRIKKIESLKKQIKKLEKMNF